MSPQEQINILRGQIIKLEDQIAILNRKMNDLWPPRDNDTYAVNDVVLVVQLIEVVTDVTCVEGNVVGTTKKVYVLAEDPNTPEGENPMS